MKPKSAPDGFLRHLPAVLEKIKCENKAWKQPVVEQFAVGANAPFKALVSTLLSLRTKDAVTEAASLRLFARADSPQKMLGLSAAEIEKAIYPAGFYRTKAKNLLLISRLLIERHQGKV